MSNTDNTSWEDAEGRILARIEDGVGWLTFNNPERRNAVSLAMWQGADRAITRFADDACVRVVVLTGAGDRAFVSGADISKFEDERATKAAVAEYNSFTLGFYERLEALSKPTIARIRGWCIGGGMNLAVCCDMRVCTDQSKFGIPAARLGLGYGYPGLKRLNALIGPSMAKELLFTARHVDAEEARIMGLVNRVVPDADLDSAIGSITAAIAGNAPLTIGAAKQIVGQIHKDPGDRDMALCEALVQQCFDSEDYIEGRRAFMEKRPPRFSGK